MRSNLLKLFLHDLLEVLSEILRLEMPKKFYFWFVHFCFWNDSFGVFLVKNVHGRLGGKEVGFLEAMSLFHSNNILILKLVKYDRYIEEIITFVKSIHDFIFFLNENLEKCNLLYILYFFYKM